MASTYLSRTFGTATNRKKFTISLWFKKASNSSNQQFLDTGVDGNNQDGFKIHSSQALKFNGYESGTTYELQSNALLRDSSAWYNAVVSFDSTQSTSTNRLKMYLNGEQITSFSGATYPSLNFEPLMNKNTAHFIGSTFSNSNYFDGAMAMVEFVDGQQYGSEYFGSTDSNTGIWKPGGSSTISDYGTNGFKLKMDTTTPGADTSGKGNNYAVAAGTFTLTQGSPSNNWATWNPLAKYNRSATFANGNTTVNSDNNSLWDSARGTFGFEKGKWYWETKFFGSSAAFNYIGVCNENAIMGTNDAYDKNAVTVFYNADGGEMRKDGNPTSANYGTFSTSDVCGVAVDADNNTISIYKNNSIIVTNYALSTSSIGNNGTGFIFPNAAVLDNGSGQYTNFGEGFFGTVAAGTSADGNGQGLFAFSPPSGYYAINTKNLEAYG